MRHHSRSLAPSVSVLFPYRDAGATVEEALGSVLAERSVDLEVLAIDDGSTDDGPGKVARLAARDDRVRLVAAGGAGIARALALGASMAEAPYLARMDADDVSLPGRFAAQLAVLEGDSSLGVAGTLVEPFGDVGEGARLYVEWLNGLVTAEDHARDLFVEAPLCHPSVMIRRSALEEVGGYQDVAWAEDYDLWLRLSRAGHGLAKAPSVGLRWRQHEASATRRDGRYGLPRFDECKARYLAPVLKARGRPIAMWGAGKTGKRLGRALGLEGAAPELYVEIDPRKIGGQARGAPVVAPSALEPGKHTVVIAVGARGGRAIVRGRLKEAGFVEGVDFLAAS